MNEKKPEQKFTGFQSCLELAEKTNLIKSRRIQLKNKQRETEVILNPDEYLRHMEEIREKVKEEMRRGKEEKEKEEMRKGKEEKEKEGRR